MKIMPISQTYNMDCLTAMREFPDKFFELAIVDPPFAFGKVMEFTPKKKGTNRTQIHATKEWNDVPPPKEYFEQLFRVSKDQIIWGANYFTPYLPISRGWVFWDKFYENTYNFSAGELAFTSFDKVLKMVRICQRPNTPHHIHPNQKPVTLYKWLLTNYAKQGDKILDTHLGSQSSRIAAYDLAFDFWGMELDPDYFKAGEERFAKHIAQGNLFQAEKPQPKQELLFA